MKKYIFLVLMVFSLGVFAASVDMGAKGSLQLNPQANRSNQFVIGQTDVTLAAANKNIAFNYIMNINNVTAATLVPKTKYAFVSGKLFGGNGQVGLINPIVDAGFGGGFYGTSTFFSQYNMDGAGLSYATGPWTVAYTGAATLLNDGAGTLTGKLGVSYVVCDTSKAAIIMEQNKSTGTMKYNLYVEKSMAFGALDLSAQIMWGLQDTAQKQLVAVYANYALDKAQSVYATFVDDLADVDASKSLSLGYGYAVNESVTAVVDYTNVIAVGTALTTAGENLIVGLNFVL